MLPGFNCQNMCNVIMFVSYWFKQVSMKFVSDRTLDIDLNAEVHEYAWDE